MRIFNMMKKSYYVLYGLLFCINEAMADIPTPKDGDFDPTSSGYVVGAQTLTSKIVTIIVPIVAIVILIRGALGISKAYNTAHDKGDFSHFWSALFMTLVKIIFGEAFCYAAWKLLS